MGTEAEPRHTGVTHPSASHYSSEPCTKVREILSLVGDKWSVLIVAILGGGPMRFSELKRAIEGVSQRMLTATLRGLERDGLVTRTVTPSIPPRVDYELTDLGHSLRIPVNALNQWTIEHIQDINRARIAFDEKVASSQDLTGRQQERAPRSVRIAPNPAQS